MFRITCILLLSSAIAHQSFCQGENNSLKDVSFKERIVTGGGFGLSFGTNQDFFSVSPSIGYMLTKKLIAGTGVTYRYTNYKVLRLRLNDYGVNPFLRYMIYKSIFAQAEYEYLNYELPISSLETIRADFSSILAGGGFIQPLRGRAAVYFMALYNFSYQNTGMFTPYDSPLVIRAGINFGNFGF